jgi:RNA-directed DNA polymerase
MKESNVEGIANHDVPESCVAVREDGGEALTGVRAGRVLSREIRSTRTPTPLSEAEGHTHVVAIARRRAVLRGRRPLARAESPCARTGRSPSRPRRMAPWAASERPEAVRR